ncbi:MAG: phage polymerase-related protein [Gammaproteobacteria bacterium]|jgi:DNA polymerase|nr:phage polymerase-related protein [Gammaproteobacteria bacterium]
MSESVVQQRHYLKAMGIDLWLERREAQPSTGSSPKDWQNLEQTVSACQRCELHLCRKQTVFGRGTQQARLMLIGEAPGAEEDRQGLPFVGRAGQLLDKIIMGVGLSMEDIYIANILKCRPPNNRDPNAAEVAQCKDYLQQQVDLLQPQLILALGRIAAHNLLNVTTSLSRLRGSAYVFGQTKIPLWVSYHPAYLLRNPADKARAYEDWLKIAQLLK